MISDKNQNDDSAFGGVFGNAFGNIFGDDKPEDKKEEENCSKRGCGDNT
jgi:hypothetical protein